jgi:hypothetical protein
VWDFDIFMTPITFFFEVSKRLEGSSGPKYGEGRKKKREAGVEDGGPLEGN